ncbi:hypothetical protein [Thalassotalea sediminis]|uniref:hypothetical protein n=1 Tax=Thalassotalea sediminis TaxID=1759089 RepID=UPI002572F19E|nr:hypothetical protein [Thalassotalea sediminis]
MEQKNITLASLAWKIEISEFERKRISCLLSNIEHPASNIFKEYIRKYKPFPRIARSLQKEINGFRVGSKNYHKKAIDIILKELQSGVSRKLSWELYLRSIAEYFYEKLSAFNTLMQEVKVEVDSPIDSMFILKEICKHASEFQVDEKAITEVYELWPFERQNNISEILSEIGKHAELGEVQRGLKELSQKLDLIKNELPARIKKSVTYELKTKKLDENHIHFEEKINKLIPLLFQKEFSTIQESTSNLVIRMDKLEKEFSESTSSIQESLSDISDSVEEHVESFTNHVKTLDRDVQKLQKIESATSDNQPVNTPYYVSPNTMHFKWFNNRKEKALIENIDEKTFVKRFSQAFDDVNAMLPVNYHSLLASSPVIVLSNGEVADAWINALGWDSYAYRIAASPTWSSVDDWYEGAEFIFSEKSNKPKILLIYDFDLGLVEGYLLPILKVWRASGYGRPYEKIILISSNENVIENNNLHEPVIWLPEKKLSVDGSNSPFLLKQAQCSQSGAVSIKSFVTWLDEKNIKCSSKLRQKMHQFFKELKNIEIQLPLHIFRKSDFLLEHLTKNGNSNKEIMAIVFQSLIFPWVTAHYGKEKMREVGDYYASEYSKG